MQFIQIFARDQRFSTNYKQIRIIEVQFSKKYTHKYHITYLLLELLLIDWPTNTINKINTTNSTKMKQIAIADTIVKVVRAPPAKMSRTPSTQNE